MNTYVCMCGAWISRDCQCVVFGRHEYEHLARVYKYARETRGAV